MKVKTLLITLALSATQLSQAASCSQTGNVLTLTGHDGASTVYAGVAEHRNECGCVAFRFKTSNAGTDLNKTLDVLIAAKINNRRVRIDISDENDCNSGLKAFIE